MKFGILILLVQTILCLPLFSQEIPSSWKLTDSHIEDNKATLIFTEVQKDQSVLNYISFEGKQFGPFTNAFFTYPHSAGLCVAQNNKSSFVIYKGNVLLQENLKKMDIRSLIFMPEDNIFYFHHPVDYKKNSTTSKRTYYSYKIADGKCTLNTTKTITGAYEISSISPNLDVLYNSHELNGNNFSGPYYENFKTNNSLENHFKKWIKADEKYIPLWVQIEESGQYGTEEVLYFGTKLIGKFNIIFDIAYNSTNTDFALQYGNKIYTKDTIIEGYSEITNLLFNANNELQFLFKKGNEQFEYINGSVRTTAYINTDLYFNDQHTDSVEFIENERTVTVNYHGKTLYKGDFLGVNLVYWSAFGGPVYCIKDPKANTFSFVWKGKTSKKFDRIIDLTENKFGANAYLVKEKKQFWVYNKLEKYGPYPAFANLYRSDKYLFLDDSSNVYYTVIEKNIFIHYKNGQEIARSQNESALFPFSGSDVAFVHSNLSFSPDYAMGRSNFDNFFFEEMAWRFDYQIDKMEREYDSGVRNPGKEVQTTIQVDGKDRITYQRHDDITAVQYKNEPCFVIKTDFNSTLITKTENIENVIINGDQLIFWENGNVRIEEMNGN